MTNDGKRGDHNATRGDWCSTGLRDLYRDLDTDDNGITRPGFDRVQVQHTDAGDSFARIVSPIASRRAGCPGAAIGQEDVEPRAAPGVGRAAPSPCSLNVAGAAQGRRPVRIGPGDRVTGRSGMPSHTGDAGVRSTSIVE